MKPVSLSFCLLFLISTSTHAQIPLKHIITDTVKPVIPGMEKDIIFPDITNPGFEDGLTGWTAKGNAFTKIVGGDIISSDRVHTEMNYQNGGIGGDYWKYMSYPIGAKGQRWLGTYENGNGEVAMGTLTSSSFKMGKRYLHFLMGGGRDGDKLYVELQIKDPGVAGFGKTADGYTRLKKLVPAIINEELFRYWFDLNALLNKTESALAASPVIVRIVIGDSSASKNPPGHINVDDFKVSNCLPDFLRITREGKTLFADKDHPVWGFADTHAHPMANLAFGGRTMTGDIDGPMATALGNNQCILNGHQPNLTGINPSLGGWIVIQGYDSHGPDGYPTFGNWPRFDVDLHQPMYIDWIKRSYQGGLRLLSVLGVTNMFWATRALGVGHKDDLPIDDEAVLLLAIKTFKELASRNSSWMEVALTPQDARRIILENKLAIILGCEMDNFGDFKDASYKFDENYPKPPSSPLVALSLDSAQARIQIQNKIKQYYSLGMRQFTPLHYISGVFGGSSVFRFQFGMIEAVFTGLPYTLKEGKDFGVDYHFYSDKQTFQAFGSSLSEILKGDVKGLATCDPNGTVGDLMSCESFHSTVNAKGLTDRGKILYQELMNAGVVIDADHASIVSASEILDMAKARKYPILSSHSDPQETCLSSSSGAKFVGNDDSIDVDFQNYGTTRIQNISTEFTPSRSYYENIANSGGMAGLLMLPFRKKQFGDYVLNNCEGSSKSWAQNYSYLVNTVMKGKGIAISSDKGFTEAVGPRFGPSASYKLKEEKVNALKYDLRTEQRRIQDKAIKYDIPFLDWNPKRFEGGDVLSIEEDIWKALAFWEANPAISGPKPEENRLWLLIPPSAYLIQQDRIKNLVRGLALNDPKNLLATGLFAGTDQPWQQAIMYCFVHGVIPSQLPDIYDAHYRTDFIEPNYGRWKWVYDLWQKMIRGGTNEPLRKLVNGNRDWDFNIDGMAHYGMVPDFLQDLKNVGVKPYEMVPIFSAAEEYIKMWEKADALALPRVYGPNEAVPATPAGSCITTTSSTTQTACFSYSSPSGKYTWYSSGIYKDTLENAICCDSVITINLTINNVDTAVIARDNILTAQAKNATYQWIKCANRQNVPGAVFAEFKPTVSGSYSLKVNQNGCSAESSCQSVKVDTILAIKSPGNNPLMMPVQKFAESNKIVASDRSASDQFGQAVSISDSFAVVGVPLEDEDADGKNFLNDAGSVYIYQKGAGDKWIQVQKIVASDRGPGDHFGHSVAINDNYLIVGAYYKSAAYLFERDANGKWSQIQKLVASGSGVANYFGSSVAIDGQTAVIGATEESRDTTEKSESNINSAGALYVFERTGSNWQQMQKLVCNDRGLGDELGTSVSISGNYIIAGAMGNDFDANAGNRMETAGAAYIFERSGSVWKQVQKLVANDRTAYDEFGYSVSISGDIAIVGAERTTLTADENSGIYTGNAYIFSRNTGGGWSQVQKLEPADRKEQDRFGVSVAISGDYLIVGSPGSDFNNYNEGALYVYNKDDKGNWTQLQKLFSSDLGTFAGMGISVALSSGSAISGAIIEYRDLAGKNDMSNSGAAYIFMQPQLKPATNPLIRN